MADRLFFTTTQRGELVETQFDTCAMGLQTLYGRVIAKGPHRVTIRWESGLVNSVVWGRNDITKPSNLEWAREAMARAEGTPTCP